MARRTSRSSQITRKYNSRLLMADDTQRERKREGHERNTRYKSRPFQVGDPTINNDFSWQPPHLGPLLLASTTRWMAGKEWECGRRRKGRERRALFFRERPRTEVARGGAPSVGGPPVELKLMDKGRRGLAIFIELTFLPSRITRRARVLLPPVHARDSSLIEHSPILPNLFL